MTPVDEIRALKTDSQSSYGQGIDEGLARAAALAEAHESALDRMLADARKEGMREAYELCKGVRKGAETDDYGIGALDCAIAILAAAEKEAANG